MKRLLFIGPAPHNIGGISIHIRRLSAIMRDTYALDYVDEGHVREKGVFNLRSCNIFKYLSKVAKADIVHINSGVWSLRAIHIFICKFIFRKRVLVTIHRDPTIEPHLGLTKRLLRHCDCAILVNSEGYEAVKGESKCKYILLPAFLPPVMDEEPELPEEMLRWIDNVHQKGGYLMTSNASNLVMHSGEDLYGLDICIDSVNSLEKQVPGKYYLLFILAKCSENSERLEKYKDIIKENGLGDNIMLWEGAASFVRALQKSDLVLRTTNTDGDAISIREALFFGKLILASDVVARPDGVHLFKTRDTGDLVKKILSISSFPGKTEALHMPDYKALYKSLYE